MDRPYEYDRDSSDFPDGPTLLNGSEVKVCYAKSKATPAQIVALAREECGRFGLAAKLSKQRPFYCPLRTPIAAVFVCRDDSPNTDVRAVGAGPVPVAPAAAAREPTSVTGSSPGLSASDVSNTAKSAPFPTFLFNKGDATQ